MKRFNTLAAILAIAVFTLVSTQSFAQTVENETPARPAFVDEDGDGICDNFVAGQRKGLGNGTRANFVDADGDGVCDNQGTRSGERLRDGSGKGAGTGSGACDGTGRSRSGRRAIADVRENSWPAAVKNLK